MPHTVLRIKDWDKHFENNRTRELKKMTWVPFPNKQDGDGYTDLMSHLDGVAHFGCWIAICQVASKCDPRGTLLRDNPALGCDPDKHPQKRPHDTASLSRMTRVPEEILKKAIDRLIIIGWLETYEIPAPKCDPSTAEGCALPEGNGTEGKGISTGKSTPPVNNFPSQDKNPTGTGTEPDSPESFDYSKAKPLTIHDYQDIHNPNQDPILIAIAITGEHNKPGWGHWTKVLNQGQRDVGTATADRLFRGCLAELWGEMKAQEVNNPGALLNFKLKRVFG